MSYRGKVKTGDDSCKARDNVEHIFGDGFEHNLPRSERRSIKLGLYFDMTTAAGGGDSLFRVYLIYPQRL